MNARMIEAAIRQAENAFTFGELCEAAAALRAALEAPEEDEPFDGRDADALASALYDR